MSDAREETAAGARHSADESAFQEQVRASLRRNFLAHAGHGLLGQTGMRLVNAPTLIPAYIDSLGGSAVTVGLARGLQYAGMFLTPVLGATLIEHRRRVLPVGFAVGVLMRVQVLGIALSALLLPPPWPLVLVCVFLGLFGFLLGIQGVVFNVLVSKVIPVDKRGVLLGLRNALAGLTAAGVAVVAGPTILDAELLGNGYGALFLLAFGLTSLGLSLLLFVREPESPRVRERSRVRERLRDLPSLLRSDRGFTRYFLARALATMGRMGQPFYVLYAGQQVELTGSRLGVLTAAFILAQNGTNLLWGAVADRRGFRVVFLLSLGVWMLAVLLLLRTAAPASLPVVFMALGAGMGGFQMSAQNLVLEFGSRQNLPLRVAVANSASDLVAAGGVLVGGLVAFAFGYATVFWTAIAFQVTALGVVALSVPEPRYR